MHYEDFINLAPAQIVEDFRADYQVYSGGDLTVEQYFYANCQYWEPLVQCPKNYFEKH
jgi:hypothetical protein